MAVPLLDLKAQWAQVGDEIKAAIEEVYATQMYIGGPVLARFEEEAAAYCGTAHAVGCASGSDAIVLALLALGIGPGDEVVVPTFTFFATAGAVTRVGATPVFADIDPVTYNLLPGEIARVSTPKTKAVIPVHLFGQVAEMGPITDICRARGLFVIEDAAQSIGAKYQGLRCGKTGGHIATFSFFPSKNLGGLGDGGMCVTDDAALADKLRILRSHGAKPKYHHKLAGMNSRLDAVQAAALRVKLRYLEDWHAGRRRNAAAYDAKLASVPGIATPEIHPDCWSIYNQYTIRITGASRDEVTEGLGERGIGHEVYYPLPLHLQECYSHLGGKAGDFPHAEQAAREVVSIPVYPELREAQQDEVVHALRVIMSAGKVAGL
jgi:dTDP-4-amino-4,6-dideoxygalactose transaminase